MSFPSALRSAHGFVHASRVESLGDGRYAVDFPETWTQGHGIFGGLLFAALGRAFEATAPDRKLRIFSAQTMSYVAPGPAEIRVTVLRSGRNVTFLRAELVQGERLAVTAQAVLGTNRAEEGGFIDATMPEVPGPEAVSVRVLRPGAPPFCHHFAYRYCLGKPPFSGAERALTGCWVNTFEPGERVDSALLLCLLDAIFPGLMVRATRLRQTATLAFTAHFGEDPHDLAADAPLLLTVDADFCHEGYAEEVECMWAPDGRLLARAAQSIIVMD